MWSGASSLTKTPFTMNYLKPVFFFLLFCSLTGVIAQSTDVHLVANVNKTPTEWAGGPAPFSAATFPGGQQQLFTELTKKVIYPDLAREYGVEGTVVILLQLDRKGQVTDRSVIKGLGFGCEEAALAALDSLPDWNPARASGRRISSNVYVPIRFRLR